MFVLRLRLLLVRSFALPVPFGCLRSFLGFLRLVHRSRFRCWFHPVRLIDLVLFGLLLVTPTVLRWFRSFVTLYYVCSFVAGWLRFLFVRFAFAVVCWIYGSFTRFCVVYAVTLDYVTLLWLFSSTTVLGYLVPHRVYPSRLVHGCCCSERSLCVCRWLVYVTFGYFVVGWFVDLRSAVVLTCVWFTVTFVLRSFRRLRLLVIRCRLFVLCYVLFWLFWFSFVVGCSLITFVRSFRSLVLPRLRFVGSVCSGSFGSSFVRYVTVVLTVRSGLVWFFYVGCSAFPVWFLFLFRSFTFGSFAFVLWFWFAFVRLRFGLLRFDVLALFCFRLYVRLVTFLAVLWLRLPPRSPGSFTGCCWLVSALLRSICRYRCL